MPYGIHGELAEPSERIALLSGHQTIRASDCARQSLTAKRSPTWLGFPCFPRIAAPHRSHVARQRRQLARAQAVDPASSDPSIIN
jgi:hypothetical protein